MQSPNPVSKRARLTGFARFSFWSLLSVVLAGCATTQAPGGDTASEGQQEVEDLYIVECLLPGQVRRLGATTYTTPRRPIRTTAGDCELRGGEYVAYDRADYRSALNVWLGRAKEGDPKAQNYVGEIFEKGLGRSPDYRTAFMWYQRAAEQGYSRAQINLGYLYEKGLGVEQDTATALNWYRRGSGLEDDTLVYGSEARKALAEQREKLEAEIAESQDQVAVLEKRLENMVGDKRQLAKRVDRLQAEIAKNEGEGEAGEELESLKSELAAAQKEIDVLEQLYTRAKAERTELGEELAGMPEPSYRNVDPKPVLKPEGEAEAQEVVAEDTRFGRYFALIIGDEDYHHLEDLKSPRNDARRVRQILEERYGFSTTLLLDASERDILTALNELYERVGPEDNLLVYYAGHGNLSRSEASNVQRGYWLPVDAGSDWNNNWIHNSVISDHLDRIRARSVMVVADSCYAGDMASQNSPFMFGVDNTLSNESLKIGLERRARVVIASGGESPVLDTVDGEHSIFARSLIDVLESNERILSQNMLFSQVAVNVRRRTNDTGIEQTPEMRPIRAAGHEGGDFYFVPRSAVN